MVVLTIVTQKNGEAISFEKPIPQANFIKLVSCCLYNSWLNLKKEGSVSLGDNETPKGVSVAKIKPGHYTLESLANAMDGLFAKRGYDRFDMKRNEPFSLFALNNHGNQPFEFDRDLLLCLALPASFRRKPKYWSTPYLQRRSSFIVICSTKNRICSMAKSQTSWLFLIFKESLFAR